MKPLLPVKKRNSLCSLLLITCTLALCSRLYTASVSAAAVPPVVINPVSYEIKVSASIGEPKLTLYGWGPVKTKIYLTGLAVAETQESDTNGFFIFTKIFLPYPHLGIDRKNYEYPELCLQAVDEGKRSSQPTCIPPLPAKTYSYDIGPVLLSPIISLEKGRISEGEQASLKGKITPFTPLNVYLANQQSSQKLSFNLIKTVNAYYIPKYQTVSDKEGNFEFNLPNKSRGKWNIFVASETLGYNSPKSNSLTFSVISPFLSLLEKIIARLKLLKPYLLYIVILFELVIITTIILLHISSENRRV